MCKVMNKRGYILVNLGSFKDKPPPPISPLSNVQILTFCSAKEKMPRKMPLTKCNKYLK